MELLLIIWLALTHSNARLHILILLRPRQRPAEQKSFNANIVLLFGAADQDVMLLLAGLIGVKDL